MPPRVCVFVDGENFRHSIGDLFPSFRREDYLPKTANWAGFFDWLVNKAAPTGQRVRTYWYVVQYLDFWPWDLPNPQTEPDKLGRVLSYFPS